MSQIGQFIEANSGPISQACLSRARTFESAQGLTDEELLSGLPAFVSAVASVLKGQGSQMLDQVLAVHFANRLRQGFGIEDVVNEIMLIGPSIFCIWSEAHPASPPDPGEVVEVGGVLQHAAAQAVGRFTHHLLEDEHTEKRYSRLLERIAAETFVESPKVPLAGRLPEILQVIAHSMNADAAWLYVKDRDTAALTVIAAVGALDQRMVGYSVQLAGNSLAAKVARSEDPLFIADLTLAPLEMSPPFADSGLRSMCGARIWAAGRLLGVLKIAFRNPRPSANQELVRLVTFTGKLTLLLERARLWEALTEKSERLHLALDSGEIGIWEFSTATRETIWDDRCREFWGLPPGAPVSYDVFLAGIHPDDRGWVDQAVQETLSEQGGDAFRREYRTIGLEDGVERWIASQGKVRRDPAGHALQLIGVMRDITDEKRALESLRKSEARLLRAEQVAVVAAQLTNLGTFDYQPQSGEMIWSEQKRMHFGISSQVHTDYQLFLKGLHPDDRERVDGNIQAALRGENGGEYADEFRTIGIEDGKERWLQSRGKVFFDEEGLAMRIIGGDVEITDRKRIDELRERLFGIVSHDLRNPLNAIKMAASSLAKELPVQLKMVTIIDRCTDRMNRMIYQLLDFTRVRFAAGMALEPARVDLAQLCSDAIAETELAHPKRNVHLQTIGNPVGAWDPSRLGEVVSNLIGNAQQYGDPSKPLEVRILGDGEAEVILEVHNYGVPIPEEMIPVIFDPFRRGKIVHPGSGLGLGLFIAREIVTAHGGEITCDSEPGKGTTFHITLPAWEEGHP